MRQVGRLTALALLLAGAALAAGPVAHGRLEGPMLPDFVVG